MSPKKDTITTTVNCQVCRGKGHMANGEKCLYCDGKGYIRIELPKDPNKKKKGEDK